ncbi:DUF1876 family protein [Phycicoccus sp. MAQZ13P-2]|uniref:dsRBD fold-containing protein n=1 Tax=Phycicoccus mangrovi TaxID=2840470 RepID=UPI001C000794|nr:dsRBD fold-containing protein [Phycicoccus mangrovi]MBT9256866.1 DUF1876 family protein [Phycicoccus mangrovi]MBT9274985.1 DUF1876 family protein [Phycicoccus mangrovi]
MRAHPGHHIVLTGERVDQPARAGEVLGCGPDGEPPWTVRWDDGHTSTLYPGAGSVLRLTEDEAPPAEADPGPDAGTLRRWSVRVTLFETGDDTTATVALLADAPEALTALGRSHRSPRDPADPHIGDAVAVARALRVLADRVMAATEHDIEARTGEHDVQVRPR